MLRGLAIARSTPVRSPAQVGISTSQDRLAFIQRVRRKILGQNGNVLSLLPPDVATRGAAGGIRQTQPVRRPIIQVGAFNNLAIPKPSPVSRVFEAVKPKPPNPYFSNMRGKLAAQGAARTSFFANLGATFRANAASNAAAAGLASNVGYGTNSAPGLPSGPGTPDNPITVPGTETSALSMKSIFIIAGAAFVLWLLSRR